MTASTARGIAEVAAREPPRLSAERGDSISGAERRVGALHAFSETVSHDLQGQGALIAKVCAEIADEIRRALWVGTADYYFC
jgi:hypothetical protein